MHVPLPFGRNHIVALIPLILDCILKLNGHFVLSPHALFPQLQGTELINVFFLHLLDVELLAPNIQKLPFVVFSHPE